MAVTMCLCSKLILACLTVVCLRQLSKPLTHLLIAGLDLKRDICKTAGCLHRNNVTTYCMQYLLGLYMQDGLLWCWVYCNCQHLCVSCLSATVSSCAMWSVEAIDPFRWTKLSNLLIHWLINALHTGFPVNNVWHHCLERQGANENLLLDNRCYGIYYVWSKWKERQFKQTHIQREYMHIYYACGSCMRIHSLFLIMCDHSLKKKSKIKTNCPFPREYIALHSLSLKTMPEFMA